MFWLKVVKMTIESKIGLDNHQAENPLTIENGLYYWNSGGTNDQRVENDFVSIKLPEINGVILDLGCSTGDTTKEISKLYPRCRVIGIDRNHDRINEARVKVPQCEFLTRDIYDLQMERESVNAVFCMNNLWYLISKKRIRIPEKTILDISEIICERGYLFFSGSYQGIIFRKENKMKFWNSNIPNEARQFSPQLLFLLNTFQTSEPYSI